jgi:hypothetical protein
MLSIYYFCVERFKGGKDVRDEKKNCEIHSLTEGETKARVFNPHLIPFKLVESRKWNLILVMNIFWGDFKGNLCG